ncbi:C39 family peptidase [Paraburkholderia sp. J8-2]|uniref:C39 family peptidase n=1 Tax=Paraburkholderia sp. J8-2 TaxID=2805440 RepID=UPI002AB706D5|nr:C39 family peptidase [Paraburkholderia sp. J8-2]
MIPFLVCGFGKSTISNLVKECFGSDFPDIFRKLQIDYIYRYLKDLGAKSVLLEFEYVDRDYLEDHSRFYVKRFSSAGHKCARMHFFSCEVDHELIHEVLKSGHKSPLQDAYLGFMVIKPLPQTFIGKTCLKHYPGINETTTKHSLVRKYEVNLFGIDLQVDSIAFQEQDKVVSACATTSIWSALHAIDQIQIRDIPSCSEITTNAINFIEGSSNSFPNKELSNKQIMRALDVQGLRHHGETLEFTKQDDFLRAVIAYIDSGIPLILGVDVYAVEETGPKKLAGHAVTILGYSSAGNAAIYLHDDRLGPFVRATFTDFGEAGVPELSCRWGLALCQKDDNGQWLAEHEVFLPSSLIVPTHNKVRLPLRFALNTCDSIAREFSVRLNEISTGVDQSAQTDFAGALTFSVSLQEITTIKRNVRGMGHATSFTGNNGETIPIADTDIAEWERRKLAFLTGSYARFQWVGRFYFQNQPAFQVLIDATDIPQGNAVSAVLIENQVASEPVLAPMRVYAASSKRRDRIKPKNEDFLYSFLKCLNPKDRHLNDHLDSTYGELRAPKYLKESEFFENGTIKKNTSARTFYESTSETLQEVFDGLRAGAETEYVIWAVSHEGGLLIGREIDQMGHPCLTGFKPARIAGELKRTQSGWLINSKSGRYSGDYREQTMYLGNALEKFRSIFYRSRDEIWTENDLPRRGQT